MDKLINDMLSIEPAGRPTMKEVKERLVAILKEQFSPLGQYFNTYQVD
ncbi:MAG: hypothetical protein WC222_05565 [Parachlamydiales bacterium]|jgi:hypothetical protein